jgi:outer membrane protein TolC
MVGISQSARNMKLLPALAAAALLAPALLPAAEPAVRPISIDECIQQALQKNLDIRISRYLPDLSEAELWGSYAAYDPTFRFSANRRIEQDPGGGRFGGFVAPPSNQEFNSFNPGLNGVLPTGTTYSLTGNAQRINGTQFNPATGRFEDTVDYVGAATATVSQPLLRNAWIDSARWTIRLAKGALKQDEQAVRLQIINTVTAVQVGYYNLFAAREAVRVQENALELAERSLVESKKKVEVGMLAPLEEKRSEARVAAVRVNLITARQALLTANNDLKRLITDDYASIEEVLDTADQLVPAPYVFNRQDSWHQALTLRPDIIQQQISVQQQDVTLRFRRNQLFPQLDVNASYISSGRVGRDEPAGLGSGDLFSAIRDRNDPTHSFGAVLSIPLSNRGERSRMKAAKLTREQLLLQLKRLEQTIMVNVDNAILNAQKDFERIGATRDARLFAQQALEAEQKKLENGKSTYFEVLNLQSQLITAAADAVNAVADYYRSVALLHQAEGSTLDKVGVKLDFR